MEARDDQPRELEPPRMHALNVTLCHDTVTRFRAGAMTNDEEHDLLVELMSAASPVDSDVESAT
jgi:hypothetical protein